MFTWQAQDQDKHIQLVTFRYVLVLIVKVINFKLTFHKNLVEGLYLSFFLFFFPFRKGKNIFTKCMRTMMIASMVLTLLYWVKLELGRADFPSF